MAPLIQYSDFASSSFDDVALDSKEFTTPLHESILTGQNRRVSFGAVVQTHEVLNRDDYTQEEKAATWICQDDMRRMKANVKSEGKLVDSGLLVECASVSTRGLESRTRQGCKRKRQNRMAAYAAVFCEIDFQVEEHITDQDAIADAYFVYSEPCAVAAEMLGKRDEADAMAIHNEPKTDFFGSGFCQTMFDVSTTERFASAPSIGSSAIDFRHPFETILLAH
jgi:hypothetical protein